MFVLKVWWRELGQGVGDDEGGRREGRAGARTSGGEAVGVHASLLQGRRRGEEEVALGQAGHEGEEEAAIYYAAAASAAAGVGHRCCCWVGGRVGRWAREGEGTGISKVSSWLYKLLAGFESAAWSVPRHGRATRGNTLNPTHVRAMRADMGGCEGGGEAGLNGWCGRLQEQPNSTAVPTTISATRPCVRLCCACVGE